MNKRFTKDGKIYNLPIKIQDGNKIIITNDENVVIGAGYTEYVEVQPEPVKLTLDQLITRSDNEINKRTDDKILNEFTWNENEFYLTIENQANFANMFVAREYLTYPQKVKTKTGFIELNNKQEVAKFYVARCKICKTMFGRWLAGKSYCCRRNHQNV